MYFNSEFVIINDVFLPKYFALNQANSKIIIINFISILIASCSVTKQLSQEEKLISKQIYELNGKKLKQDPITILSKTSINKKILGTPLKLMIYNLSISDAEQDFEKWLKKKEKRRLRLEKLISPKQVYQLKKYKVGFNNWLREIGEPPSLYDSKKVDATNQLFKQYYDNLGYYNSKSIATVTEIKNKKVSIKHSITTGERFLIDSISYKISSKDIDSIYRSHKKESLLKKGEAFEVEKLNQERERLINLFSNNGIYNFQQRSIRFKAFKDISGIDKKIPILLEIKNSKIRNEEVIIDVPYVIKKIKSVSVFVNSPEQNFGIYTDSININGLKIFSLGKLKYNPKVISDGIEIIKNKPYRLDDRKKTYNFFNELQIFKYPSILYKENIPDSTKLDTEIYLIPKEKFSLGFDFDLSHSNIQDIGVSVGSSIISRNVFRGAEILEFGVKGSVGSSRDVAEEKSSFFNLFEVGLDLGLRVPRPIAPSFLKRIYLDKFYVKTRMSLGVSVQENIGLDRQTFTGNFEYYWRPDNTKSINIKLVDIEYVDNRATNNYFNVYRNSYERLNNISKTIYGLDASYFNSNDNLLIPYGTDNFINDVLNLNTNIKPDDEIYSNILNINERKNRLTANNFIVGSAFSFLKNNQESILDENFSQFKFKSEVVGNLLSLGMKLGRIKSNENGFREIFNLAPSQYFKSEVDYIKYWSVGFKRVLAFRTFIGIAIPFGNSNFIPFTRSYYAGGSNDNRAWQAYKLGPGSSSRFNEFNEANFKIAFNVEYRYPIIKRLNGAFFIDSGNIWNFNNNVSDSKQVFNNLRDLSELAIGSGFGLRYDFDYFIFRLDTGFKTYDPSLIKADRWFSQLNLKKAVFNVGINFPF